MMLPLQSEAELVRAGLDLVLRLKVSHAVRGNAVNGQNDVTHAHLGPGRLSSICELQTDREKTVKARLTTNAFA